MQTANSIRFKYDDGGRAEAGFKGETGDCVVRAIAIAANKPYREVYNALNKIASTEKLTNHRRNKRSNARTGVFKSTYKVYLTEVLGWKWVPLMFIGQGCTHHLADGELPNGRLVLSLSRHMCAVIDGVVHDIYDPSRGGKRCVYGYFTNE